MNPRSIGWDDDSLNVESDASRVARYRRLQSWYREEQLGLREPGTKVDGSPLGSALPATALASRPDLNFLAPAAYRHALDRAAAVRMTGGTLEEDRLYRNMLSSMPLCFNIFGALGTHPAFVQLIRALVDPDATAVGEVSCEWAPQPPASYLNDRSAFDAYVAYEVSDGNRRFVGVETKYTEPFSPKAYARPEYDAITERSTWFKPGAADVLRAGSTNQLWRTVMLATAMELKGAGRGHVLLLSCDDDPKAAECAAAVADQLTDPTRLVHVTYERLVEAASQSQDSELTSWAEQFALRYLDPTTVGVGRAPSPVGPTATKVLSVPDRVFDGVETLSPELVAAFSWAVASRVARRHPDLEIVEEHPGGGTYDCLAIRPWAEDSSTESVAHLNRVGSIHIAGPTSGWAWRGAWAELAAITDFRFAAQLVEHHAGLPRVVETPAATPASVAYRFVATLLLSQLAGSHRWQAWYDFGGETWSGLPVPEWPDRDGRGRWILYRDDAHVAVLSPAAGVVHLGDGSHVDLMALYRGDRRITALVVAALGTLVS